jgi:UDP-2,3-diacylglucosamine hydrolase
MNDSFVPRIAELTAPPVWRTVDFISDLHLQAAEPATFEAWRRYMASTPADAVFILGDLFEVWVGDDAASEPGFEHDCAAVLREATGHRAMLFMPGNRDFLVGAAFLASCGVQPLADPTVLGFAGQRWLLSHGDALCLDDVDYQRFRAEVRCEAWQRNFLARPLPERQAIARGLRQQSEARKRSGSPADYADVDPEAARQWLAAARAGTLIHGHTHKPADHGLGRDAAGHPLQRTVLSDWDAAATPPRTQVLRLTPDGLQRLPG